MSPSEVCEMQAEKGEPPQRTVWDVGRGRRDPQRTVWDVGRGRRAPWRTMWDTTEEGELPWRTARGEPVSASPLSVPAGALSSSLESEGYWIHPCSSFILCLDEALGPGADTHA